MWTKQEAEDYISGKKSYEDLESKGTSQPGTSEESSPVDNVESTGVGTATADKASEPVVEDKSAEPDKTEGPEKTGSDVVGDEHKQTTKKEYTALEKQRYAWKKQKEKQRALRESLAAKQSEIDKLTEKLKKYEALTVEDFKGDVNAYVDYRLGIRDDNAKINQLSREMKEAQTNYDNSEMEEINRLRVLENFPDEKDRTQYMALVWKAENGFNKMHPEYEFASFSDFIASEEDHTILDYIQDSDNAPKLIRHFIFKPEQAEQIMYMRSPDNKRYKLRQIEENILRSESEGAQSAANNTKSQTKSLPETGKIVANDHGSDGIDWSKPMSKRDAENYIKNHRR